MKIELSKKEHEFIEALLRGVNLGNPNEVIQVALSLKKKLEEANGQTQAPPVNSN